MSAKVSWVLESDAFVPGESIATIPPGIYEPSCPNCEVGFEPIEIVTDDILIPPDSLHTEILSHIRNFFDDGAKYAALGLVHKTSLLLSGDPGCGKTTVIEMVANDFISKGGVCLYSESTRYVQDALANFRKVEPTRNLLVIIEDIEACDEQRLLSILDGEETIDHVCFVFTTNKEEEISERLGRPGRIDTRIKMLPPSAAFREFYVKTKLEYLAPAAHIISIVKKTDGFTLAELRLLLVLTEIQELSVDDAVSKFKK